METTTTQRREFIERNMDTRDLRYFDASPDNLTRSSSAGEGIRRYNAREARAQAMPETMQGAVATAIRLALPNMDDRDVAYTYQALQLCPALKD